MFDVLEKNLEKLGYKVSCFDTAADAAAYLDSSIDEQTVGFGGSMTLVKMGLFDMLSTHNTVHWHQFAADKEESTAIRRRASEAKIYVSSVNAIAETGELINIDGICNRVASIFYGHEKVYLVAGKNKIAPDYDSALFRARNVAAPMNAKRLNMKTPCAAKADHCYNCKSPDRICRGLSVLWSKPMVGEFEIVLINEELGY